MMQQWEFRKLSSSREYKFILHSIHLGSLVYCVEANCKSVHDRFQGAFTQDMPSATSKDGEQNKHCSLEIRNAFVISHKAT